MFPPNASQRLSSQIDLMADVMHRINGDFSVHYCQFLLCHVSTETFHYIGNLPLAKLAEFMAPEQDAPPAWVPKSVEDNLLVLRHRYASIDWMF